jgi:hypothetical protein
MPNRLNSWGQGHPEAFVVAGSTREAAMPQDDEKDNERLPTKRSSQLRHSAFLTYDPGGDRTRGLRIKSPLLYQLSYRVGLVTSPCVWASTSGRMRPLRRTHYSAL